MDSDAPIEMPIEDPGFALVEGLAEALRSLPARDRTVIAMRFSSNLTQSQIAECIGISQIAASPRDPYAP